MGKTKQLNTRIPSELHDALEAIAAVEGQTVSDVAREAIAEHVERKRKDREWQERKRNWLERQQRILEDM